MPMSIAGRGRHWVLIIALVLSGCGAASSPSGGASIPPGSRTATASPTLPPSPTPASPPASPTVAASPSSSPAARRPIVVDTDLGADDLLALAILLHDPDVEVLAVTVSGTGLVHCPAGLAALADLLLAFGDRQPIGCGRSDAGADGLPFPAEWRGSSDTLYGIGLPHAPPRGTPVEAARILADAIASSPTPVSFVALGPWTDLEDLLAVDPTVAQRLSGIHAMAGAIDVPGNVAGSPAEWNVRADPSAFATVLGKGIPVTLVPLDATNRVPLAAGVAARAAEGRPAAGASLAFELFARNPFLLGGGQYLWDETAALALLDATLVTTERVALRVVETGADAGRLVRDAAGVSVIVALDADAARIGDALARGLARSEP